MAKQQQFIDLFAKYDENKDGEIDQQEFINIITELEVPYQYPGTVSKTIRKLNYANPEKETLNLEQAKEYYNSFESVSKHQIWKSKISLLNKAEEIKGKLNEPNEETGAAPAAAPGMATIGEEPQKRPQQAHINILIGDPQPVYTSEIDVRIEKTDILQKVKPFVKLTITSKSEQRAKLLETVFKQNVNKFFEILSQQQPDYADLLKEIHINSMTNGTTTTFFITTTNEQVTQYIQLLGEFIEITFNTQFSSSAHLRYEFEYDFEKFINEENSSFYDIFTRNVRLSINVKLLNLLKSLRKFFKVDLKEHTYMDQFDAVMIGTLFHLEGIEGDFEFQNSEITEYELQTKEQLKELLKEWREFFDKLTDSGMKVKELIQLLDDTISIEFKGGEWKVNVFLRLKNFNRVFLQQAKSPVKEEQASQQYPSVQIQAQPPAALSKSSSNSSVKSKKSLKIAHKTSKKNSIKSEQSEDSDD